MTNEQRIGNIKFLLDQLQDKLTESDFAQIESVLVDAYKRQGVQDQDEA